MFFRYILFSAIVATLAACSPSQTAEPTRAPASTQAGAATRAALPTQTVAQSQPGLPTRASVSESGTWSTRAPLPQANSELAIAQLGDKIYLLGGYPSSRISVSAVQVYDAKKDSWELTTPLPRALNHSMAAVVNGKIYVFGGQTDANAAYVDSMYEFDPGTAVWKARAAMPTARSAGAAVVIAEKIYVVGGRPPRGNDFAAYDPRENSWATLPNMPTARNHIAAAAIGGKIYVVGGRFGGGFDSEVTDAVEMFDPGTQTWVRKAPMPTARGGVNGIEVNGCFHVWGGEGQNKDHPLGVFPEHEVYNPLTDSWMRLANLPTPIHGVTGAAFIDGWIHLPGGGTSYGGSSGSTIHQVYKPEMACR